MSTHHNPFILPGLGQTGDLAGNPMMASLEMMQQAWTGLAGPGGLAQTMPVPMSLEDLDRRIAELRTVENWLKLNQSMLSSTIQGMEVQRATIATLHAREWMSGNAGVVFIAPTFRMSVRSLSRNRVITTSRIIMRFARLNESTFFYTSLLFINLLQVLTRRMLIFFFSRSRDEIIFTRNAG